MTFRIRILPALASLALPALLLAVTACSPSAPAPEAAKYGAVSRAEFNRWALRLDLPLFWVADDNGDGQVQPGEVSALLFYPTRGDWVAGGRFTPAFDASYERIVSASRAEAAGRSGADERQKLVGQDLDQGRVTLLATRLADYSASGQAFIGHMQRLAHLIDALYSHQTGATAIAAQVPADDPASQSLFRRDHGPRCAAPLTENNPQCSAIPGAPKTVVDVYPASLQGDPGFCAALEKRPDAARLMGHFSVVREQGGKLLAVPYSLAYHDEMSAIAEELRASAAVLDPSQEAALIAYLRAAADSFLSNEWQPADEAWAAMNTTNSKWYVRAAPDEVYWEPCSAKAGFQLTFARVDSRSLEWQNRLNPLQDAMEAAVAERAGAPYRARKVKFHLPDFIAVIFNAGDARDPLGGTLGESLPNWGKVVDQGRGRTMAVTNLSADPDTIATRRTQAMSLLDANSMKDYPPDGAAELVNTILHEATHNLGPAQDYRVNGKRTEAIFGGDLDSMLEELKAQTGALFFVEFLRQRKLLDDAEAAHCYLEDLTWALGHISQGMYDGAGARKTYGNLAAIQVGLLLDAGALSWEPAIMAANGKDPGALVVHPEKLAGAVNDMMRTVTGIKARGDKARLQQLIARYVDSSDVVPHSTIAERYLREPKDTFVYAVR